MSIETARRGKSGAATATNGKEKESPLQNPPAEGTNGDNKNLAKSCEMNDTTKKSVSQSEQCHPLIQFLFCAAGINMCYLYYGIVQEELYLIMKKEHSGPITAFTLVTQAVTNALAALGWMAIKRSDKQNSGKLKHGLLSLTSLSFAIAMTSSNAALNYVSYPTAALAKSCKLVPTMIAGILVEQKNYSAQEWLGAFCLIVGIVLFNMSQINSKADHVSGGEQLLFGLSLLFLSLVMDGVLCWCQGFLKKKDTASSPSSSINHHYRAPTAMETMLWTNIYSVIFFAPYSLFTGQYQNGMDLLVLPSSSIATSPRAGFVRNMILLNVLAAAGQFFIFYTIEAFSPIICTTITTTRKFFSILLSVRKFGHVLSLIQWASVGLVFTGLHFHTFIKVIKSNRDNALQSTKKHKE